MIAVVVAVIVAFALLLWSIYLLLVAWRDAEDDDE